MGTGRSAGAGGQFLSLGTAFMLPVSLRHGLLELANLVIGQQLEVRISPPLGELAAVLEAETDEQVDVAIGHIDDRLHGSLCLIVVCQERQLFDEFCFDGLLDEAE